MFFEHGSEYYETRVYNYHRDVEINFKKIIIVYFRRLLSRVHIIVSYIDGYRFDFNFLPTLFGHELPRRFAVRAASSDDRKTKIESVFRRIFVKNNYFNTTHHHT